LNAVADVWFTVLIPRQVVSSVSDTVLKDYAIQGGLFYARRGNPEEIKINLQKLAELVTFTEDMYIQIGDALLEAGVSELAVQQYQNAISLNPNRKDIARKIADYYIDMGNKARETKKLEEALDWFKNAANADPLHPNAERLRLEAEHDIKERDARLAQAKEALERADKLQSTAEQEALTGRIAEAIVLLKQALLTYNEVTDEFPLESQQKNRGIRIVNAKIGELKGQLLESAKNFSGKYPDFDLQNSLKQISSETANYVIKENIETGYQQGIQSLLQELPPNIMELK
jgi:tetratricopeptide (TPR) repeat protein